MDDDFDWSLQEKLQHSIWMQLETIGSLSGLCWATRGKSYAKAASTHFGFWEGNRHRPETFKVALVLSRAIPSASLAVLNHAAAWRGDEAQFCKRSCNTAHFRSKLRILQRLKNGVANERPRLKPRQTCVRHDSGVKTHPFFPRHFQRCPRTLQ